MRPEDTKDYLKADIEAAWEGTEPRAAPEDIENLTITTQVAPQS
jgi:hypothetical protein